VMVGRASIGQPWLLGMIAAELDNGEEGLSSGSQARFLSIQRRGEIAITQYQDCLSLYGDGLGVRMARKHLAAYIEHLDLMFEPMQRRALRAMICEMIQPQNVIQCLENLFHPDGASWAKWALDKVA